jgi:hypothetical protein
VLLREDREVDVEFEVGLGEIICISEVVVVAVAVTD